MKHIRDTKGYRTSAAFDTSTRCFTEKREQHPFVAASPAAPYTDQSPASSPRPVMKTLVKAKPAPAPRTAKRSTTGKRSGLLPNQPSPEP